jgi:NAD-dependent DNA ligase
MNNMNTSLALVQQSRRFLLMDAPTMTISDIYELQNNIRELNRAYYQENTSLIDDRDYDTLFALLKDAEEFSGIFDPESPTKRIDVLISRQFEK